MKRKEEEEEKVTETRPNRDSLVAPCVLPAKLILRQLCKDKLG